MASISRNKRGTNRIPLKGNELENEMDNVISIFNNHDQGILGWNYVNIQDGTNQSMGQATLSSGSVTVNNTRVTASTRIFLTHATAGSSAGILNVGTVTAGTSFVIESSDALDDSKVNWLLIEPK